MVVSPDVGGVVRARALAKRLGADLAIVDKRRERAGESEVMNIIGDVEGRTCILIDDIVDSGGTICNAAEALLKNGAKEVYAYATHGVLSGGAVARIAQLQAQIAGGDGFHRRRPRKCANARTSAASPSRRLSAKRCAASTTKKRFEPVRLKHPCHGPQCGPPDAPLRPQP